METLKLEFTDGRRIDIEAIYGSPRLVHGSMRDTLQIEIDPDKINFNSLKALFSEISNLEEIHSVTITNSDDGQVSEDKTTIGQGYTILVSITDENRMVYSEAPGTWEPPTTKEVFIVTIAQETYAEHQLRITQNSSK